MEKGAWAAWERLQQLPEGPRTNGIARPREVTSRLRAAGFRANQVCLFT